MENKQNLTVNQLKAIERVAHERAGETLPEDQWKVDQLTAQYISGRIDPDDEKKSIAYLVKLERSGPAKPSKCKIGNKRGRPLGPSMPYGMRPKNILKKKVKK